MTTRFLLIPLVILLGLPIPAAAQSQITTGIIQGEVLDASGAVLPGVNIEVQNLNTNLLQTLVTDTDGRFVVLQLPPGRYRATFRLSGFATMVREDLQLTVGQAINLNLRMAVSAVQETVTVVGTPGVETLRSASATTLNQTVVETTPILGRKFEDLLTLTPGVSVVQGPDGDSITFAGQRGISNNISLDGGDYNNGFFGEQVGGQRAAIDITLDAVQEFQVIATGAPAEFGRTAGGVVNVITKSGTNELAGSLFHFQRLEGLTGELSDGSTLEGFHREQFGGTVGGPVQRDRTFFFAALEGITGDFERPNLGRPIGTPCPVAAPTLAANEGLIRSSGDCQRVALLNFFGARGQQEGNPVAHPITTLALLLKADTNLNASNRAAVSYNFNHSRKENETFDVATYGNSANGVEGDPSRINVVNANLFTTLAANRLNEFHVTYGRESRPRRAVSSGLAADTGMGFAPSFRFGNPFFLQPGIDELLWRSQIKNNFTFVDGRHTVKMGGEWMHTLNDQVFRGFFTGRYLFDSVPGFLRYASPAAPGGFGPRTVGCSNGAYVTAPTPCPAGSTPTGGPLLFYLQGAGRTGPATDAAGASRVSNEELSLFIQDQWQVQSNISVQLGLRWDAQVMPDTVDPRSTAFGSFLSPAFPSDGTIPSQWSMWQPRVGATWDVRGDGSSVVRGSYGIYFARQNMLSQVGSVTTNGVQQQTIFANTDLNRMFGVPLPVWPDVLTPAAVPQGRFPDFTGVRIFDRDYRNPRTYSFNIGYEEEFRPEWFAYADYTWARGRHLTRFLNYNRSGPSCCDQGPGTGNTYVYSGAPYGPQLGEVMVTTSRGRSQYNGFTLGLRKRFADRFQFETNYVLAQDKDDDSNERDPFTDRSFNFFDLSRDYALSDRDIRHKFNFFGYYELPQGLRLNTRVQARGAQPMTPNPRSINGTDLGRNSARKDNDYFSLDWRLTRGFRFANGFELLPAIEMFNTFNNANNINPLTTPALFNFDGFLRTGVGDPRQMQVSVKLVF